MLSFRSLAPLGLLLASACQSYAPDPVDLAAHAREFAARLPDPEHVRRFGEDAPEIAGPRWLGLGRSGNDLFDPPPTFGLAQARLLALLFHPDCRLARRRAGVVEASAAEAGRFADPVLGASFERILESVQHPWLVAGSLGFTLPLSGRLDLERELAWSEHAVARAEARRTELAVLDRLDRTWLHWSRHVEHETLLRDLCTRLDELTTIAERLATAGEIPQMQARAFRLERQTRGHELAVAEAAAARTRLELQALVGLHPATPLLLSPSLTPPPRRSQPTADAVQDPTEVPRLQILQLAHAQAEHQLALAIRQQWPDLGLSPGLGEEDAEPRISLGLSIPLPLFTGNAPAIARARAERDLAAEALRGGYEHFVHELALAEQQVAAARSQRDAVARDLLPLAAQQVEDGRRLADHGQLDALLLLDALVRAHAARTLVLDLTLAAAEAEVATESLFWPDLLAPTTPPAEATPR